MMVKKLELLAKKKKELGVKNPKLCLVGRLCKYNDGPSGQIVYNDIEPNHSVVRNDWPRWHSYLENEWSQEHVLF